MFLAVLVAWAAPLAAAPVDARVTLATPTGHAPGNALRLVATHAGYAGVTASQPADASGREPAAELTTRGALLRLAPGSWTLHRSGGRLALTWPPAEAGQLVYLLHAGFVEPLPFVQSWAALQDGGATASGDVVLPQMEAGTYTVCLAEPGLLPALLAGARPPRRCVSGTLPAGGELALALPGDSPPAPGAAK
jgi:hypothetical protein